MKYCAHTATATKFATSLGLQKGRKGGRNPPLFSCCNITNYLIIKRPFHQQKCAFCTFYTSDLESYIYEIEILLHFFWDQKKQIPADAKESGEGSSLEQCWTFPQPQVNSFLCSFPQPQVNSFFCPCTNPSRLFQPLSHSQLLPSTLSYIRY